VLVAKQVRRMPSALKRNRAPGWPLLPHDRPYAGGPALEAVAVEFGHPGAVTDLAVGLDGRRPGRRDGPPTESADPFRQAARFTSGVT
jgi:hypothetical protein